MSGRPGGRAQRFSWWRPASRATIGSRSRARFRRIAATRARSSVVGSCSTSMSASCTEGVCSDPGDSRFDEPAHQSRAWPVSRRTHPGCALYRDRQDAVSRMDNRRLGGDISEFLTGSRAGGHVERSLQVVLFTDIVGSTDTAAAVGDGAWRALLTEFRRLVREILDRYGGRGQHPRRRLLRRGRGPSTAAIESRSDPKWDPWSRSTDRSPSRRGRAPRRRLRRTHRAHRRRRKPCGA